MGITDDTFIRSLELDSRKCALTLYQQEIGDVNCVVWDAALVLAKYLDSCCQNEKYGNDWLCGKRIVELGAGIGCVGMTAACLGAKVISTDLERALPILVKNIDRNEDRWRESGGSVRAQVLEWGNEIPTDLCPDIILLADCVYYTESIDPLLETLVLLCQRNPAAYVILSQEERNTPGQICVWERFVAKLGEKFKIEGVPVSEQHPIYSSHDIHLMKLRAVK